MAKIKQIGMAVGTFSVALGIGFVMQNGDALASRFSTESAPEQPAPFTAVEEDVSFAPAALPTEEGVEIATEQVDVDDVAIPVMQAGVSIGATPSIVTPAPVASDVVVLPDAAKVPTVQDAPVQLATLDAELAPVLDAAAPSGDDIASADEIDCVPLMVATAGPAASVNLAVAAPCHAETPFTVHHQGMMFTAVTDANGQSKLSVPALSEVAVMIAAFDDGDGAVATAVVADFAAYDRAVLQWQGDTSVMLSAYEGDAEFGDDTHIYAANPGNMARVEAAEGGYLVQLGDASIGDALMAEVYTFPTGMMGDAPNVMLVAEAEITIGNCGQELNAQSIQVSPSGETSSLDLTMIMPDCDAIGDFLILQNMFEDLTLAAR